MNGLDRFTFGFILLVVGFGMVLLGVNLAGRTEAAPVAPSPEAAVQQMLLAAHRGQYDRAALFFEEGREIAEHSPSWARQYIDRVTEQGNALAFEVHAQGTHGEERLLQITTYTDQELTNPLRTATWYFIRRGAGWLIRKVE